LYARTTAKHHKLFDLNSLVIISDDKLDDTYNLEMLIEHMRSSHDDYEMDGAVYLKTNDLKIN
jgi:hypothetical protein